MIELEGRSAFLEKLMLVQQQLSDSSAGVDSKRIFHGRGRLCPGYEQVCVDVFDPVVLVTLFSTQTPEYLQQLKEDVLSAFEPLLKSARISALVLQRRDLSEAPIELLGGVIPESLYAQRDSLKFSLSLGDKQNLGFFLDMEPGRAWLEKRAQGKKILNLFSYTCAFSAVAVEAGAQKVVNVDMSSKALSVGRKNHQLNGHDSRSYQFLAENILKSWGRIKRPGPYDIIIIDPPSYQPGSFIAEREYHKLVKRIEQLAAPGAEILACLNAPELPEQFLKDVFSEHSPYCEFIERLEPSGDFPDADPNRQLKLLSFCYRPQ